MCRNHGSYRDTFSPCWNLHLDDGPGLSGGISVFANCKSGPGDIYQYSIADKAIELASVELVAGEADQLAAEERLTDVAAERTAEESPKDKDEVSLTGQHVAITAGESIFGEAVNLRGFLTASSCPLQGHRDLVRGLCDARAEISQAITDGRTPLSDTSFEDAPFDVGSISVCLHVPLV